AAFEEAGRRRAGRFRAVHGDVRIGQDMLARLAVGWVDGDADAHADLHRVPVERETVGDRSRESLGEIRRVARLVGRGLDYDEFVAAEAGEEFPAAQASFHASRYLDEYLVAARMTEDVIYFLEPIEVEAEDRE